MDAKKKLLGCVVENVAINLNQAATTEIDLFLFPTGTKGTPITIVLHSFSAAVTASVVTIGKKGGACEEFLGDQTLTNIAAAGDYVILQPIPNATPVKLVEFAAGETIALEITTDEGGALTCKADVYSKLIEV